MKYTIITLVTMLLVINTCFGQTYINKKNYTINSGVTIFIIPRQSNNSYGNNEKQSIYRQDFLDNDFDPKAYSDEMQKLMSNALSIEPKEYYDKNILDIYQDLNISKTPKKLKIPSR